MVVVEGDYIYRLDEVMKNVEGGMGWVGIGDFFGRIPEAVFVFLPEKYPEKIFTTDHRNTLSPTMV